MRAFLGLALPQRTRQALTACRIAAIGADPSWRGEKWVAEENLHVTVRFLGDVETSVADEAVSRLLPAVRGIEPYRLTLDRVAIVPRLRVASLIWAEGGPGAADTAALAAVIDAALEGLVPPSDRRRFRTHATLCRARHPRRLAPPVFDALEHALNRADERSRSMSVQEVTLYSSVLTPTGPVYREIAALPLGG
ncbi:MAG: RNA 2',3'-cyclic phosphodiesterase [Coriobacteriia bacterium]|nr:RNA 2',3'-cyclic phosphodiesterase [Actinomycetota bacterium]MDZ4167862.1 RNA 2',3'-cyclic phosphodiesterase [Coriobacteriia bacterium]